MKKAIIFGITGFLFGNLFNHYFNGYKIKNIRIKGAIYDITFSEKNGRIDILRNNQNLLYLKENSQNKLSTSILSSGDIIMNSTISLDDSVRFDQILFRTPKDESKSEYSFYQWIDPSHAGSEDIAGMRKLPNSK